MQQPSKLTKDNSTTLGSNGTNQTTELEHGGMPAKSNKLHDYFTSALPAPQKGEAVKIALGNLAKVVTGTEFPVGTTAAPAASMT